jgi:hypothetical protein
MNEKTAKEATKEVVEALKCILDAQTGLKRKEDCKPIVKAPIIRFCKIARETEQKVRKEDPSYDISRFLGASPRDRKKIGVVCNCQSDFPKCDDAEKARSRAVQAFEREGFEEYSRRMEEYSEKDEECRNSVVEAIREKPIEKCEDWSHLVGAFETMRDWMHVSGYAVPDYVWVVPRRMREKVKHIFDDLSSQKIRSSKDLEQLSKEVDKW